jgi:hypothetical protein
MEPRLSFKQVMAFIIFTIIERPILHLNYHLLISITNESPNFIPINQLLHRPINFWLHFLDSLSAQSKHFPSLTIFESIFDCFLHLNHLNPHRLNCYIHFLCLVVAYIPILQSLE